MKNFSKILFILIFALSTSPLYSQIELEEQTAFLDSVLVDLLNSKNPESSIAILDQQLNLKNSITEKLKFQIVQIDKDIKNNELYFKKLHSQLSYEKDIYQDLIVRAQRINTLMHQSYDVFSFDNLYRAYRQFLYIKWMSDYRKKKIQRINDIKNEIEKVVEELEKIKSNKNKLAEQLGVEQSFINKYNKSRINILKDLDKPVIVDNKINKNNLDSMKVSGNSDSDTSQLFKVQKGYLIWPVHKAVIISYFGEKPHPKFEKVMIKNDGLEFCVPSDSKVACVYNGVVTKISTLQHKKYVVIVRHGSYFTVYNGLDKLSVDVGDEIEKGETIGTFDTDEKSSVFNFQIWHGSESLDPYVWLEKSKKK